ncbi:glycoside hydrolase family 5 protein [Didymella exigua CBS 183.55]|uniref:glucan 1,3-beta-glucosidase n=1 Tax=Didymella exigua CBS 183.55 TaxID=1150837 RepID=A0A6A5S1U5_9PLEO|nr:glycoside hydrolase family 5 protein [Didymella exigua CBS 183.55]KAF1933424.1 glycoside hydrolase family 5 protein [Didymella exigua CBS 183.55]
MTTPPAPQYVDWRKFKANGVNLGSWFCLEHFMMPKWFEQHGNSPDEWTACEKFGAAGADLDSHYKTWFTNADVDTFAAHGVNVLRIPFVYAAWIKVPGSPHYHGPQVEIMKELATYAIEKYGMHIVLDLHGLPGGINWLDIGEAHGHGDWFYNEKNLEMSYEAVDAVLNYIQNKSGHPESYTLAPVNEAVDSKEMQKFGTPLALSDKAADWLLKYILGVIQRTEAVNKSIPIMFQDSFKREEYWSSRLPESANIVIDTHNYFFAHRQCSPETVLPVIEQDAKTANKTKKFPVVIGEWSIEMELNNQLSKRKEVFDAGRAAFSKYTQGSIYWSGRVDSDAKVAGEGGKRDYWSYLDMIKDGVITPWKA